MIDLNPLEVLELREISFLPSHFAKVEINESNIQEIKKWIKLHLNGRYGILRIPGISNTVVKSQTVVAFEDHKELTYFMLACPFFRRT